MARRWDDPPVVVGADGTLSARRAVAFAAEEARRRGVALRIVTAADWPAPPGSPDVTALRSGHRVLAQAEAVLGEAADLAEELLPPEAITVVTVVGRPVLALVEESVRAAILVIGRSGAGAPGRGALGPIATEVLARARCPVVIVSEPWSDPRRTGPPAAVTVGVAAGDRSWWYQTR